jgi:hypothetical protein
MTLEEVRRSEEDSYSGILSPEVWRAVREKVEKQRREKAKRKQRKTQQHDEGDAETVDSGTESRSSRWVSESQSHPNQNITDSHKPHQQTVIGEERNNTSSNSGTDDLTPAQARALARAAADLATSLTNTLVGLQTRKTESDAIHDLLVQRCEQSTERVLLLEYRLAEMDDDFSAHASELTFLRIRMQAIEAQCAPYLERGREEDGGELSDSIARWKIDWEEVNRRMRARRERVGSGGSVTGGDGEATTSSRPGTLAREMSGEVPMRRTFSHHADRLGVEG